MSSIAYTNYAKPLNNKSDPMRSTEYQYTLLFRQQLAVDLGMTNVNQALILELLRIADEWAKPEYVDGKKFYWTARQKICAELPLLDLKPDTVARYLKSLAQLGLIEHIKSGKKDLTRVTEKALLYVGKKSDIVNDNAMSEKNPNNSGYYVGKISENDENHGKKSEFCQNSEKNPTYQYKHNINNNIPPISPQGGQDAQQVVEVIASEPTASQPEPAASETVKPKRKPRAARGEVTAETEQAMKDLINGCECGVVPKGFLLSYLKYRHTIIKKPIKSTQGLQAQINVLAELPTEDAMKTAIKYTMDHEWIKIVVPDAVKTAMAKTKNSQHIDMPRFDLSDGGTKLQKWAVGQGFRAAKGREDAWAYLEAVKTWVAEKNGGAV